MMVGVSYICVFIVWYRSMDIFDSRDKVVRFLRLVAMGVVILLGLILSFFEIKIIKIIKVFV